MSDERGKERRAHEADVAKARSWQKGRGQVGGHIGSIHSRGMLNVQSVRGPPGRPRSSLLARQRSHARPYQALVVPLLLLLLPLVLLLLLRPSPSFRRQIFDKFDTDHSGELTVRELRHALAELNYGNDPNIWEAKDQDEGTLSVNDLVCCGSWTVFDRC